MNILTHSNPDQKQEISLGTAALVAGLALLVMALTVPVVEFYIFPRLVNYKNAAQTAANIADNLSLFSTAIFIHFTTIIADVVIAWALYMFLKPVHKNFALLTAWMRLIYATFNVAAVANLVQILTLLRSREYSETIDKSQIGDLILFYIRSFNLEWRFGLVFFGIYLLLLGCLVFRSSYVPKIISVFLMLAGAGYLADNLKYFFWPGVNTGFLWFTFFGELIFMAWLLIKGARIKSLTSADPNTAV